MPMRLSFNLIESQKEIALKIANALIIPSRKFMQKSMDEIKKGMPDILKSSIINSPEYAEILGGRLRYEFGIPNPREKLEGILDVWTNNLNVTYSPPAVSSGGQIKSEFSVSLVTSNYSDVLGTNYAQVYDNVNGYTLPWLKWLLLDGSVAIIKDHVVVIGPNKRSRTGMAVMREYSGKSWNVPKQYAGTVGDNWITRSIAKSSREIRDYLEKVLKNYE